MIENNTTVSYLAHEGMLARMERANRRLWIIIIILIVLLFGTNAAWIYYEAQFGETVTETITKEATTDGGHAIINDNGAVTINGESEGN